ncbi:glutathione S-transferase family protein [Phenylobacterium aquaticum]|uniref:glutathione S-transferase family protein n=1 Tax=Phenylobacterium aquaticum TaxID=1763816 RepID=UPI0026EEEC66|nr:glutathione S-transferase family protein [Phenylobacterium aquaticum]
MMLIGQYDSPFVRRVAIALRLYAIPYEHKPWSTFGDAATIAAYNPLIRVPTLVFDDGVALMDSFAILETLDERVGPERAMIAASGPDRREAFRLIALAAGAADKAVSLLYERALRGEALEMWVDRCRTQVCGALDALESARAARTTPWLFGETIGHADIILATMLRFVREALPGAFDLAAWPAISGHAAKCEALPVFQEISQPYHLVKPGEG